MTDPERNVTLERLGAWVIKCNPRSTPLAPIVAAGHTPPSWCVAANYRSALMRRGQRVLFWVVAHPRRGIWGAGRLTGEPAAHGGRLVVPVRIPLLDDPVTATELATLPGLRSMELFRSPQQANPSWMSTAELAVVEPLLGARRLRC